MKQPIPTDMEDWRSSLSKSYLVNSCIRAFANLKCLQID